MKKKETRKDIQADFEAMDMLKDNETTSGDYGDIESILDSLDDGICSVMDKHIAKNFTSKNGYLFFEDEDILDSYEFAMNILKRLIKHTHKKDVKFCENCGKSEYAHLNGLGATHCDRFVGDTKIYSEEEASNE